MGARTMREAPKMIKERKVGEKGTESSDFTVTPKGQNQLGFAFWAVISKDAASPKAPDVEVYPDICKEASVPLVIVPRIKIGICAY